MTIPRPLRLRLGFRWLSPSLLLVAGLLSLAGCGDPGTGPVDVKWDRVTCDRCRMVLSARHYAAQIRAFTAEGASSLHFFDDIGCALIWLDQQPWRDDPRTQLWVNDWRTGQWIDARRAHYLPVKETPMQYGLGAQSEPAPGAMDFVAARRHVLAVEEVLNAPIFNPGAKGQAPVHAPVHAPLPASGSAPDAAQAAVPGPAPDAAQAAVSDSAAANPGQDHRHSHRHITE